jgi:hypothetical protein
MTGARDGPRPCLQVGGNLCLTSLAGFGIETTLGRSRKYQYLKDWERSTDQGRHPPTVVSFQRSPIGISAVHFWNAGWFRS